MGRSWPIRNTRERRQRAAKAAPPRPIAMRNDAPKPATANIKVRPLKTLKDAALQAHRTSRTGNRASRRTGSLQHLRHNQRAPRQEGSVDARENDPATPEPDKFEKILVISHAADAFRDSGVARASSLLKMKVFEGALPAGPRR